MIGQRGRNLETRRAVVPPTERQITPAHSPELAASAAAYATESAVGTGVFMIAIMSLWNCLWHMADSASRQHAAIIFTASSGYEPLAVSPESITQSAPSSTALATSETSARVGRGLVVIDSSICVAQMIGLPARLHLAIIIFCAMNTFCAGISMPRSPRA